MKKHKHLRIFTLVLAFISFNVAAQDMRLFTKKGEISPVLVFLIRPAVVVSFPPTTRAAATSRVVFKPSLPIKNR